MSRFTQSRRWSVDHRRNKRGQIAEHDITPEEARVALHSAVLQTGFIFEDMLEYCPRRDRFTVEARSEDGRLYQLQIPGGVVGSIVIAARALTGPTDKPMRRHYELLQSSKGPVAP